MIYHFKVMFAQSLSHGSDEAQMELQKLTEFLEREGNMGVIPIDLQKKVLSEYTINFISLNQTIWCCINLKILFQSSRS